MFDKQEKSVNLIKKIESEELWFVEENLDGYESPTTEFTKPTLYEKLQILNVEMIRYFNYCLQDYLDVKVKMDALILALQNMSLKYEASIGTYGSYFTQVWTKKSDLNLSLIPNHHKERTNKVDYRIHENMISLMKDFKNDIVNDIITKGKVGITNLVFFEDYLLEAVDKEKLDKEKNPVILFEYEGLKVNIVFDNDKKYSYHITNQMRNFFIQHTPSSAVFYTLETLMQSVGLLSKTCLSHYDIFSMIYEYSHINKTGNCALFLYKMLDHFLKKKKFSEQIDKKNLEKSMIIETLELQDPFNPHVSLLEGKNVTPLLSRFSLILTQIEKCETREVLRSLFEMNKILDRIPSKESDENVADEKEEYDEKIRNNFEKKENEKKVKKVENKEKVEYISDEENNDDDFS